MRTIKFRVWDPVIKWYSEESFTPEDFIDGGYPLVLLERADLVFLQYTGSKDKNGVEIYEGDIVEWSWEWQRWAGTKSHREIVEFKGLETLEDDELYPAFGYNASLNTSKIIGNIYENAELMGDYNEKV